MRTYDLAIVGATGLVGEAMLTILAERNFPVGKLYALASDKSSGNTVLFVNKPIQVEDANKFDFSKVQLALFSAGGAVSRQLVPRAEAAGCLVIDNTSTFRYDADVPLIIPEVNAEHLTAAILGKFKQRKVIANPNCSTIQMLLALKPIYDAVGISKINVATYQSVAGTGRAAIEELAQQAVDLLNMRPVEPRVYPCQIAFNVIPQIDQFQDNGFTKEEMKMIWETKKILADPEIIVNPTTVRVPVFYGHSEAIHIETKQPITATDARNILRAAAGIEVVDFADKISTEGDQLQYPTPVTHAADQDKVFVGRIRNSLNDNKGLNLWVVADNIRKGAALNSIQIAEILLKTYFEL